MKDFIGEDFLLETKTALSLYHDYASRMPIIDYHCHLSPKEIAEDRVFNNITEAWLEGDHYKWRAMRANGVQEEFCTGSASDEQKFLKWCETVPYTVRNPLYHWTHLELKRYFGIDQILSEKTATTVYENTSTQLQTMSTNKLLQKMDVRVVCTTDDPIDDLQYHRSWAEAGNDMILLPAFRPDKVLGIEIMEAWNDYVDKLQDVSNVELNSYEALLEALRNRHDYFHERGCRLSDNGLNRLYAEDYTLEEVKSIFQKGRDGQDLTMTEVNKFRSALLYELALLNHEKGWVQQYHLGAMRNNNARMFRKLGPDTGFDSMGDYSQAQHLSAFLSRLDEHDQLAKTILYNLNPADNAMFATMTGNFNDGSVAGKIQYGSGWWFLDQKDGIEDQLNILSNMGLLSRFVGMLTDSRSFLSFPRHEYFRRILCNLLGKDVEKGELPNDINWLGKVVQDICYSNAKNYFKFDDVRVRV